MGKNNVYFSWEVEPVNDIAYFIVEKSADAENWNDIKTIACSKGNTSLQQYFFTDNNLPSGTHFYRIRLIYLTGNAEYLHIVSAKITAEGSAPEIIITQSLFNNSVITIGGISDVENWRAEVFDADNKLVINRLIIVSPVFELPGIAGGSYFITLQNRNNGEVKSIRFLKN